MNLDDLKEPWRRRNRDLAEASLDELAAGVVTRAATFERNIWRRDWIETAAAAFVVGVFAFFALRSVYPPMARVGMVMIILGALEVVLVLHWTRRHGGQPSADLSLTEFCRQQLARVERQIRLLRCVNWWYTSPPLVGACVFFAGLLLVEPLPWQISLPILAVLCGLVLLIGWWVYRINQRAVVRELLPLHKELSALYASLADSNPETDIQ